MGVEREEFKAPEYAGGAYPVSVKRAASGQWSVEFKIGCIISLPDGREIHVTKHVRTLATYQSGRRRRAPTVREAQ